jgi:hypothetical protein
MARQSVIATFNANARTIKWHTGCQKTPCFGQSVALADRTEMKVGGFATFTSRFAPPSNG